jgi:hypothetical protein
MSPARLKPCCANWANLLRWINDMSRRVCIRCVEGTSVMSQYHVAFYKDVLNPYGIPFRCLQAEIEVVDAPSSDEAAVAAERDFERSRQIPDWKIYADEFEVGSGSRVLQPQCKCCGTSMLLIRIEPYPTRGEGFALRTFQCPACDAFEQIDSPRT